MNKLKAVLPRVAADRQAPDRVSPERLEQWLRRISGRTVDGHRLICEQDAKTGAPTFRLVEIPANDR